MRKLSRKSAALVAGLVAALVVVGSALAAVTFNPETGEGFVGKGDVQTALNFKNAQMQAAHKEVTFKYVATATYAFDCEWWTGPEHNLKRHETTLEAQTNVNASVASDSRKTGQWTGWNLLGYPDGGGPTPVAQPTDADCGAEGNEMKSIVPGSVELIGTSGGLVAVYGEQDYPLQ